MNYLSVENVSKSFNEKLLFSNISFGINQGQKVALVGLNGSGKSTLLKIITGEEQPDSGIVSFRNEIKVEFLGQNPHFNEEESVRESIFNSDNEVLSVIKDYEYLLEKTIHDPKSQDELQKIMEKMDRLNAWDYESQIKQILGKLGIYDLDQKVSSLSGGQKKRVALARVLIDRPDLLILDEPTNHLDLDVIEWLENYLATANLTLLLVTHDRYFLERITNEIFELDNGSIYRYKGNYTYFLEKKAEREQLEASEVDKAKNLMRKELEWMRRQPKARGTKAKYRVDAFYDLKEKASKKTNKQELELNLQTSRQGGKILEVEHIAKNFLDKKIVNNFSYVFKKHDRIGIVGPNGVGKSTFLNMLTGNIEPDSGSVVRGQTTVFGYYTQEELKFKEDQRVIDIVTEIAEYVKLADGSMISASQFLQHFLFPPATQYNLVKKLSGGEKRRLQLLRVLIKNPNFLILDEPTNDLDISSLNVLEDFLMNFGGCLLLVSHDRYFMDRLVDHLFVFEGDGNIRDFPGNYTDYREYKDETEKEEAKTTVVKTANEDIKQEQLKEKKKLSFKEKKEYEYLTKEIEQLESKKETLIAKLNSGSADHTELTKWAEEVEVINQLIDQKTERWIELAEYAD